MKAKKKTPVDYPQLAFRLSQEKKDSIMKKVDAPHIKLNKKFGEDEYKIKKNDILVEAISIRIKALLKK